MFHRSDPLLFCGTAEQGAWQPEGASSWVMQARAEARGQRMSPMPRTLPVGRLKLGCHSLPPPPGLIANVCRVDRVTLCYAADLFSSRTVLRTAQISSFPSCVQGPAPASSRRQSARTREHTE